MPRWTVEKPIQIGLYQEGDIWVAGFSDYVARGCHPLMAVAALLGKMREAGYFKEG